jgi:hypothetical protein
VPSRKPLVVALFNTSSDLVDLVRRAFEPAYDANWMLFKHIRSLDDMRDRKIVLTSMNKKHAVKESARERPVS